MKSIYVDIDGILTNETEGHDYKNRTPNEYNIHCVNCLYQYYKIILWTARYSIDNDVTRDWLQKYGVKYTEIIYHKPKKAIFIDDRAFNNFNFLCIKKLLEK